MNPLSIERDFYLMRGFEAAHDVEIGSIEFGLQDIFGVEGKVVFKRRTTDGSERHPFDVEILRLTPGQIPYPYHLHSAQWEFYHVISGSGVVRHKDGTTPVETGDAFIFKPNEPHQIINNGTQDLILYVVADNPLSETYYYPDSNKWSVPIPERRLLRSNALDYYDGEE